MADDDKTVYEARLDAFELYHKYEYPDRSQRDGDWKAAALRGPGLPALGHAVAGATGAAVSNVATYPLKLIITRLQMQRLAARKRKPSGEKTDLEGENYTSLPDAARKIYANEGGIAGFFTGVGQDTGKTIADSFLFFLAYTLLRQRRLKSTASASGKQRAVLPVLDELAIGVVAGAFTKLWTTPLANIVTRKQTAAVVGKSGSASTRQIAVQIHAEKGLRGFWSGYSASLILTLNPSITFFLNELLTYLLLSRRQRPKRSALAIFFLAAVSKSIASSITYPFSLAKTRVQADSSVSSSKDDEQQRAVPFSIFPTLHAIAVEEGIGALYDGLTGEVLKGFFSHGITMLTKDLVHATIVHSYYALLILLRRYPTPNELMQRAREQAEEYAEVARDGASDLVEAVPESMAAPGASVDMSSATGPGYSDEDSNELAEMVGEYVEDEAAEWRSLYHWFWERFK